MIAPELVAGRAPALPSRPSGSGSRSRGATVTCPSTRCVERVELRLDGVAARQHVVHPVDLDAIGAAQARRSPAVSIASSWCSSSDSFFVVSRSASPMPPAAVASRRRVGDRLAQLVVQRRAAPRSRRACRAPGAWMSSGRIFCSARDDPVVLLDARPAAPPATGSRRSARRPGGRCRRSAPSSCARAAGRPRRSSAGSESCRSKPSRSMAMLIELPCAPRASGSGRGWRGSSPRTSAGCRPRSFIISIDLVRARRQIREDPDPPAPLHRVLDALEQLLAVGQIALHLAHVAWPATIMRATSGSAFTHLAAVAGTNAPMSNLSRLLPTSVSK